MIKFAISILFFLFSTTVCNADYLSFNSAVSSTQPAYRAVSITNNNSTNTECRAVYIGVSDNYEFFVDGSWITFNGCVAGTILPVRSTGARHDSGDSAPDSGDIVFLY